MKMNFYNNGSRSRMVSIYPNLRENSQNYMIFSLNSLEDTHHSRNDDILRETFMKLVLDPNSILDDYDCRIFRNSRSNLF